MLTFHNDPALKQKYVDRVLQHFVQDQIVQGIYWNTYHYDPETASVVMEPVGCALGCTLHHNNNEAGDEEHRIWKQMEIELGIPAWLARIEEACFEGQYIDKAKSFPYEFLRAVPVGVDLNEGNRLFNRILARVVVEDHDDFSDETRQLMQRVLDEGLDVLDKNLELPSVHGDLNGYEWSMLSELGIIRERGGVGGDGDIEDEEDELDRIEILTNFSNAENRARIVIEELTRIGEEHGIAPTGEMPDFEGMSAAIKDFIGAPAS